MQLSLALLTIAGTLSQVTAHGYLASFIANGVTYPGWAPFSDPYITPLPVRVERRVAGMNKDSTNQEKISLLTSYSRQRPGR